MSELSSDRPQPVRTTTASTSPPTAGATPQPGTTVPIRTAARRSCPRCGAVAPAHANICPTCGENLAARRSIIRCRQCGKSANAELVLCPNCGRELAAAPSRLWTVGAPVVLVGLFLFLIGSQWGRVAPIAWVQNRLGDLTSGPAEPAALVIMTPIPAEESGEPANAVVAAPAPAVEAAVILTPTETVEVVAEVIPEPVLAPETVAEGDAPVAAPPAADTTEAIAMATAPAPTVTIIGGTGGSATSNDLAAAVRAAGNTRPTATEATDLELPTSTSEATATPIPTATPSSTPTETPIPPTPAPVPTYEIRRGDTLVVIAQRHDVSVDDLMRLNGISSNEVFSIQPGDILLIPAGDDIPYPTPTETATPSPTPSTTPTRAPTSAPTATPTEAAAKVEIRLDAPTLLSPESGTPVSCAAPSTLVWQAVPYMRADDRYVMHLGFVSGRTADNQEIVTWVLAQPRPSSNTSWDMDGNLCGLAPHEFGRQWRWWVEVVAFEGGDWAPVSPPSQTWSLSWN